MSRPALLSEQALQHHSDLLPDWTVDAKSIHRDFILADFVSAIGFINAIAIHAEKMDHHPEISLYGWNKVKVTLSTHDQGGLTELDFLLAANINAIGI